MPGMKSSPNIEILLPIGASEGETVSIGGWVMMKMVVSVVFVAMSSAVIMYSPDGRSGTLNSTVHHSPLVTLETLLPSK